MTNLLAVFALFAAGAANQMQSLTTCHFWILAFACQQLLLYLLCHQMLPTNLCSQQNKPVGSVALCHDLRCSHTKAVITSIMIERRFCCHYWNCTAIRIVPFTKAIRLCSTTRYPVRSDCSPCSCMHESVCMVQQLLTF